MTGRRLLAPVMAAALMAVVCPASTPAQSPAAQQEALALTTQADEAFARDDYTAAESLYRRAVDAGDAGAHALSRLALLLTWRGEYPEAIRTWQRAIALNPGALEPRRGLATAWTWSENYPEALKLYDVLLSERPGDEGLTFEAAQAQAWSGDFDGASGRLRGLLERNPRHTKARLLLGDVRLWAGDLPEAERQFSTVLTEDPARNDALNGMGRVRTAQGRYDEAIAGFDRVLAADPKNRAALEGRAEALHLQGRTPEAVTAVREALELYPDARDARRIARDIGGPLRPSLQLWGSTLQDSDDNDLGQWGGSYTHHLAGARVSLGASFNHAQTEATLDLDTPVARYDTLRATAAWHVSPEISLSGDLGPERAEFPLTGPGGGSDITSRSHLAGSVNAEFSPAAWATIVGSFSQEALVGTTQAFMNDVRLRAGTVTGIFRPHPTLRLRAAVQLADFLDEDDWDVDSGFATLADDGEDNSRLWMMAGASWRTPLRRPRLSLNYTMRWMSYEQNLDHGYFDPDHYVANMIGFDLSDSLGRHVYWSGGMDAGIQVIDGFSTTGAADTHDPTFAYRLMAGVNLGGSAAIEAYYVRSDLATNATTGSGYTSSEGGLRVKVRFGSVLGPASPGRDAGSRPGGGGS